MSLRNTLRIDLTDPDRLDANDRSGPLLQENIGKLTTQDELHLAIGSRSILAGLSPLDSFIRLVSYLVIIFVFMSIIHIPFLFHMSFLKYQQIKTNDLSLDLIVFLHAFVFF